MWSITYTSEAIKSLSRMDSVIAKRIRSKIMALAADPSAPNNNVKKLVGADGYRLRMGDWRVVYTLKHRELTVIVVRVGHRSEVYE
jgi:mRNA interferase RelE/StbE